jgi:ribonuclease HI
MVFYAVSNGRNVGIFINWNDCNNSVKGYKNALFKKFETKEEADAFIQSNNEKQVIDFIPEYYVYTDGACSNNGKNNALAGIGIFFGINDIRNISKKIEGKQTNNTAELSAIIETYFIIKNDIMNGKKIAIVSDSQYAINCVSSYGEKCYKNNWNIDIPNKELVKSAYEIFKDKSNIKFIHIKAHTNNTDIHSFGNDNADKLANMAINLESCPYNTFTKIYIIVPLSGLILARGDKGLFFVLFLFAFVS